MTLWPRSLLTLLAASALFLIAPLPLGGSGEGNVAFAQIGGNRLPQTGGPGGPAGRPGSNPIKPKGVAEQAKEGADRLPTTPVIPQVKNKRKRFELFELDGYYRFRSDWFKKLHLGFVDQEPGGAPFSLPLTCYITPEDLADSGADNPCADRIKTANMRLRLEPTINVSETTHIHMQVDILDNLVLGSTPDNVSGAASPPGNLTLGAFNGIQAPPEPGRNSVGDAVRVRRVWAEVDTSLGHLTFGRQPWHFGLGLFANAGGANPFDGTYDLDSDFGDTVDRVMFRAGIPGTNLQAAVAADWSVTYPTAAQDDTFLNEYDNQAWDLDDSDDVNQWVFMITRFDNTELFKENLAKKGSAFNFGVMMAYRTQDWATRQVPEGSPLSDGVVYRGYKTYTPDVWLRYARKQLTLEFEGVATIGSIQNVSDIELPRYPIDPTDPDGTDPAVDDPVDIRRFGAVGRLNYQLLSGKGKVGFEVGYASGDQWDNTPSGATHIRNARPLPISINDTVISNFMFDPDYSVDLILFRELLGTVTNATYFKPNFAYGITDEIKARSAAILSLANKPVATPGNGGAYGLEFNADVSYSKGAFTGGLAYGVFFPMSAMNHTPNSGFDEGPGFEFGAGNLGADGTGDATTAQTIQARLMLQF